MFGIYLIDASLFAERLNTSLSIIFATIAYQLVIASKLPRLAYLTLLDKYAIALLIFTFAVVLHFACCHRLPALASLEAHLDDPVDMLSNW